jgi:hypothetical protein
VRNIKPPSFLISNLQSGKQEGCGDTATALDAAEIPQDSLVKLEKKCPKKNHFHLHISTNSLTCPQYLFLSLIYILALEFFIDINPSDRTTALGSTQPLTEMSIRRMSWG